MIENIKVETSDMAVGSRLKWTIYDVQGNLLLKKGAVISTDRQIKILGNQELFRRATANDEAPEKMLEKPQNPFELFYYLADRLAHLFNKVEQKSASFPIRVEQICNEIQSACEKDADALLGAVHLCCDFSYFIVHSLHLAILCELMGKHLEHDKTYRLSTLSAALTSNLGMRKIQDALQDQAESLSDQQKEIINLHPENSVKLLTQIGVTDKIWLEIVQQHHERIDGSGYPGALNEEQICDGAKLLAILDRYAAMVTSRSYREVVHAKEVLKSVFMSRGTLFDEEMSVALIKELGVYPPGVFVHLTNGETAVVIKRGDDATQTIVSSVLDSDGEAYEKPLRRDCSKESPYEVEQIILRDKSISLNLSEIWGYENNESNQGYCPLHFK